MAPIGYSLYLAMLEPDEFGGGAATWPMFAASVCLTVAFAVSITRYRLMQLDQLISSGVGYFLHQLPRPAWSTIGLVFVGTLVLSNQVIAGPSLAQALTVSTTALVLLLVLDLARGRLKKALDRHFRREKYAARPHAAAHEPGHRAAGRSADAWPGGCCRPRPSCSACARGSVYLRQGDPPLYRLAGSLGPTAAAGRTVVRLPAGGGAAERRQRCSAAARALPADARRSGSSSSSAARSPSR